MKFLGLVLCSVIFATLLSSIASAATTTVDPRVDLNRYVFEKLADHKEAFEGWFMALVNSPSIYSRFPQPRLDYINCEACRIVIDMFKTLRRLGITPLALKEAVIGVCSVLQIVPAPICRKTVYHYGDTIVRIIDDRMGMTADDFCGIANYKCGKINSTLSDWEIIIDTNKPAIEVPEPLDPFVPHVKIMHLTDVHLDLNYFEGSNGECGQPAGCCHEEHGPGTGTGEAGKYGHFDCSLARPALDSIYEHAKETHELKYIFLTGDYVFSAVWDNSVPSNSRHIEYVTTHLDANFPNVPTFPVIGNHEGDTCNNFPPEALWSEKGFDLSWLYKLFMEPFWKWVPANQQPTISRGGYYTVRPDPASPLRLVVLNTNLCYLLNFWLWHDTKDPAGQLQWFADTMLAAERANEVVYIVGHIPPGSADCWPVWSEKFDQIVNRFEGIIRGQFYGHIHKEYFTLAFDNERPISASFPGPSGVPSGAHSAYKIFLVDGGRAASSTWEIIDHETWIMNLTSSNANGQPEWSKLFGAKEEFGLESIRPTSLYDFVLRMIDDDALFQRFLVTYHKAAPRFSPCNNPTCKIAHLCELVISNSGDETQCDKIRELIPLPSTVPSEKPTTIDSGVTDPEPESSTVEVITTTTPGGNTGSSSNIFVNAMLLATLTAISTLFKN